MGEAAPNIRYKETPERLKLEFESISQFLNSDFDDSEWDTFLRNAQICSALKMGLDMAFHNLNAAINGETLSERLGLIPAQSRSICYTIPVMEVEKISDFMKSEKLDRFDWLKIKVNQALALPMIKEVLSIFPGKVAIDGNEAWTSKEELLEFVNKLPMDRILFLEQPFPASFRSEYQWLASQSDIEIWGDESILNEPDPEFWKSAFSGINVKLMKAGSFACAIEMLKVAKNIGLKTMVGCMVETSLGISAALSLESLADYMDLDGFLVLKNEPFGILKEKDGMVDWIK